MTGYLGLFISAFVAATLLPFSSEAVLAGLIAMDKNDAFILWAVAGAGNTLGALVNWMLGRFCLHWRGSRWFPVKPDVLEKGRAWFGRWGVWSLLLAWVPVIGDPLTFAAGIFKVNVWVFLGLVAFGKGVRYGVVIFAVNGVISGFS